MADKEIVEVKNDLLIDPQSVINYGYKAANILSNIISKQKDPVFIKGKQYLQFQDWQTIAKFYNTTVTVDSTKPVVVDGKVFGYEAKANVLDKDGRIISSAESSCSRDEDTWKAKPDFQIRSMAQTRSCVKALRNVFSWVVVLAGYQPVGAEEMESEKETEPINVTPKPSEPKCVKCGVGVAEKVFDFSLKNYGMSLCFKHQKEFKREDTIKEAYNIIETL